MLEAVNIWQRSQVRPPVINDSEKQLNIYIDQLTTFGEFDLNILYNQMRNKWLEHLSIPLLAEKLSTFKRWTQFYCLGGLSDPFYELQALAYGGHGVLLNSSPSIYGTVICFNESELVSKKRKSDSEFELWSKHLGKEFAKNVWDGAYKRFRPIIEQLNESERYTAFIKKHMAHEIGHPLLDAFGVKLTSASHNNLDVLAHHIAFDIPVNKDELVMTLSQPFPPKIK